VWYLSRLELMETITEPSSVKEGTQEPKMLGPSIRDAMHAMDEELYSTSHIGKEFERYESQGPEDTGDVNVDANLMKNLLESFASQEGLPGPTGNILGTLGVRLPKMDVEE
jgi:hypothetical protein